MNKLVNRPPQKKCSYLFWWVYFRKTHLSFRAGVPPSFSELILFSREGESKRFGKKLSFRSENSLKDEERRRRGRKGGRDRRRRKGNVICQGKCVAAACRIPLYWTENGKCQNRMSFEAAEIYSGSSHALHCYILSNLTEILVWN